ncbi:hypothetical protein HOLleu_16189 [Holothuria leucospilota]|uniref:Uncharacterized protein n=1 Tax=Holothuria leucospilota TaxID=206669 RepID=A0A9Q1C5A1_HOLLE|nr:hypothetical protein HOLleu_16189 [Holothuria leucospilota]
MSGGGRRGRPPLSQNQGLTRSATRNTLRRSQDGVADLAPTGAKGDADTSSNWKSAIESFQDVFQRAINDLQKSLQKLEDELGKSIEFHAKRIDDLFDKMAAKETQHEDLCARISALESLVTTKDSEINKLERMSRRNNLRIVGVAVTTGEDCEEFVKTKVLPLFNGGDNGFVIERCHRDGRGTPGRPPHILVRFLSYKDKLFLLKNRRTALQEQTAICLSS